LRGDYEVTRPGKISKEVEMDRASKSKRWPLTFIIIAALIIASAAIGCLAPTPTPGMDHYGSRSYFTLTILVVSHLQCGNIHSPRRPDPPGILNLEAVAPPDRVQGMLERAIV
jgi:hypothetical protein